MRHPVVRAARVLAVCVVGLGGLEGTASAQIADLIKSAGVYTTVGVVTPVDSEVDVGPAWGIGVGLKPTPGWGWAGSLGWFTGDLLIEDGGRTETVGRIQVRPLLGGIGYTWMSGRLATTASFTAGISLNSADIDDDYREAFGPGTTVSLSMDNSFAVRPSVEVEYELAPKLAVFGYSGFLFTSIKSRLNTPVGTSEDNWNASHFHASVGVIFYPFQ